MCAFYMCLFLSCSDRHELEELERIKTVGDKNPAKAKIMLDSLGINSGVMSDYVNNKYELLRIRLDDKADKMPSSDMVIKRLVAYFEENGSIREQQEAFYYAGSVYRDLQDTPQSLLYFLKSIECVENEKCCDSIMLRNTFSNMNDLYYNVQNYKDAVRMAQKELEMSKKMNTDLIIPYLHVGTAYLAQDKLQQACAAFDAVFDKIVHSDDIAGYQDALVYLLCDYSVMGLLPKAKQCFSLISPTSMEDVSDISCMAFAQYYELCNKTDSAIIYGNLLLDKGKNIYNMYDVSKLLFRIYNKQEDAQRANHYAKVYMQLSDSLDFGKRQELAATVNNEFKYHLDQKKEQELKEEKEQFRNVLVVVTVITIFGASAAYVAFVRKRNHHLNEMVRLSTELQRVSNGEKELIKIIGQKEKDLEESKLCLEKSINELSYVKHELQRVNAELLDYDEALKTKERQLSERMEQNKTFMKLLHQSDLESKAEDVVYAIRQSSTGKKNMTATDWKQLYQAVDELYPSFKERLLNELGNFTEQQMQVCYLIRIGLSKAQIQSMTNLSRVTVWRWVKKYDWVIMPKEEGAG